LTSFRWILDLAKPGPLMCGGWVEAKMETRTGRGDKSANSNTGPVPRSPATGASIQKEALGRV
jgi:hypothetical protein